MVLRLAGDQKLSIRQSCQLVNLSRAAYYRDENKLAVRDAPVRRSMRLLPSMAVGDSGNAMTGCGLKVILGTTSESGGCIAP